MRSSPLCAVLLTLLVSGAAIASEKNKLRDVPWFAPRQVSVDVLMNRKTGVDYNGPWAVSPRLHLTWEGKLFEQYRDMLVVVGEVSGAYGVAFPNDAGEDGDATLTYLYQHSVAAGFGYRGWRFSGFRWGFQVVAGPLWFGARYDKLPKENKLNGVVDGRLNFGWDVGPVTLGITGGYTSLFSRPNFTNAVPYVGGWYGGLYVDWWQ